MTILLLGGNGQLGHELSKMLPELAPTIVLSRDDVDLSDLDSVRRVVERHEPSIVVNAVAYNAVDQAESEPDVAMRVNAEAVGLLGELARDLGAALLHFSTDFVFDGTKGAPYTEQDEPSPLGAYGRSKLAGERRLDEVDAPALVFRTAWVYGLRRPSFVSTMLALARQRSELRVVTDQIGSPTWCHDLARVTTEIVRWLGDRPGERARDARGVYHAAGAGQCSRYELVEAALALDPRRAEHVVTRLIPVTHDAFPTPAARPAFAPLDTSKLERTFGVRFLPWREALERALANG